MNVKKICWIAVGCLSLGLGALGTALPFLPSVPFLMLAALCFGRSSERLSGWFRGTRLYRNNLEAFARGEGMPWKTKLRIMILVTAVMGLGFFVMKEVPAGRLVLAVVWALHIIYFVFGVRTAPADVPPVQGAGSEPAAEAGAPDQELCGDRKALK